MGTVALYMCMLALGYLTGYFLRKNNKEIKGVVSAQMFSVVILLLMMGARIGADEEVIASLGTIGISSVVLTFFVFPLAYRQPLFDFSILYG